MIPTREQIDVSNGILCAMRDEIDRLRADLDRANTEAALARDAMAKATNDHRAKVQNELRSVERALCSADVLTKYAALSRGTYECHVKNTIETAISALRDDASTPTHSPPFEGDPKDCAFTAYVRERNGLTSYQDGAVTPLTRELVAQLADLVAWAMPTMNHHKGVKAIAAKLRGGSTVPVEGTSDEILQLPRDDQRWGLVAQLADVVASIWGRSDCIEGEAKAIAAKLRGGA